MTRRSNISTVWGAVLVTCLALSVVTLRAVDQVRGEATLEEVLYIPSADTVKRMSLGYNGLMADLYWTRAVQYFGGKHRARSKQYQLLKPLLEITTTLDPHLIVAYQFGSIFLSQNPPEGAGDPQAAAELIQKGIRENPSRWPLYYSLGFIEWQQLHNPQAGSEAFLKGSELPGAGIWMKVMAARLAQDADNPDTARYLWTNIYENSQDKMLKQNALRHLAALRADQDVAFLQSYVERYRQQYGHYPASLQELQEAGWIRRLPLDPLGYTYVIREGRIEVSHPDELPFITKGLPPGSQASERPKSPSN
ncbi:MAG TPA: hypothetical protein VFU86_14420 [Terriglobales bacterium]|nr:hypothetical protein [Terriglobales bacterium]